MTANEEKNWSNVGDQISDLGKKVKDKIDEEGLADDLKASLQDASEAISGILKSLVNTIESTIKDEEIKSTTKDAIGDVASVLKDSMGDLGTKINSVVKDVTNDKSDFLEEE
tara:strand:+ start:298 stop:633 length:336 start_codon:yes stop_codon:yes gene_type:complete